MDATRTRRTKDLARRVWYAGHRQRRFARHMGFAGLPAANPSPAADAPQMFVGAEEDFIAGRKDHPYIIPELPPDGEGLDKQRALEERYLSPASLDKYRRSAGGNLS